MVAECFTEEFEFQPLGRREVIGRFDGGTITSDAGALLLRELEAKTRLLRRFSECFTDYRDPNLIEHTVEDLIKQRVFGIALGYEDLNDHDELRHDPLLAVLVGKRDPTGKHRVRQRDKGKALAGKSTLNRLELTPPGASVASRGAASARRSTSRKVRIHGSSSRRCCPTQSQRHRCTRMFSVPAAKWKTASRNSSVICSPTVQAAPHCGRISAAMVLFNGVRHVVNASRCGLGGDGA